MGIPPRNDNNWVTDYLGSVVPERISKWGAHFRCEAAETNFLSCPPLFFSSRSTISRFAEAERFCDGQYSLVSFSMVPPLSQPFKVGGVCPLCPMESAPLPGLSGHPYCMHGVVWEEKSTPLTERFQILSGNFTYWCISETFLYSF